MIARLYWPDSSVFTPREPAFWIEADPDEVRSLLPELELERAGADGTVYLLVSRTGQARAFEWVFPFSGQWNGDNPFTPMESVTLSSFTGLT